MSATATAALTFWFLLAGAGCTVSVNLTPGIDDAGPTEDGARDASKPVGPDAPKPIGPDASVFNPQDAGEIDGLDGGGDAGLAPVDASSLDASSLDASNLDAS